MTGALDRLAASAQPPTSGLKVRGPRWLEHATELAGNYDFWMILDAPPGGFKPSVPAKSSNGAGSSVSLGPGANMLSDLRGLDLGVSFSNGFQLQANLRAKSEQTGQTMAQAAQGLLAMAAMQQQNQESMEMLRKLQVRSKASTVSLNLSLTDAEMKQAYAAMQTRGATSTAGMRPRSGAPPMITGPGAPVISQPQRSAPRSGGIRIIGQDGGTVEVPVGNSSQSK
jgi:hypothetical protein